MGTRTDHDLDNLPCEAAGFRFVDSDMDFQPGFQDLKFRKIRGTILGGGPYNGEYAILVSIWGSLTLGNYHLSFMA